MSDSPPRSNRRLLVAAAVVTAIGGSLPFFDHTTLGRLVFENLPPWGDRKRAIECLAIPVDKNNQVCVVGRRHPAFGFVDEFATQVAGSSLSHENIGHYFLATSIGLTVGERAVTQRLLTVRYLNRKEAAVAEWRDFLEWYEDRRQGWLAAVAFFLAVIGLFVEMLVLIRKAEMPRQSETGNAAIYARKSTDQSAIERSTLRDGLRLLIIAACRGEREPSVRQLGVFGVLTGWAGDPGACALIVRPRSGGMDFADPLRSVAQRTGHALAWRLLQSFGKRR
jgi:hypothetical protein